MDSERIEREVGDWLERLDRAAAGESAAALEETAQEAARKGRTFTVLYILDGLGLGDDDDTIARFSARGAVRILPIVVRLDKRGRFGSQSRCGFRGGDGAPAYLTEADRLVLTKTLCASTSAWSTEFYSPVALHAARAVDVIEHAIATGRCHWRTKDAPPLRCGPSRAARVAWDLDEEGLQAATLQVQGERTLVLPTRPLWYLDLESQECGPLETGLDPGVAAALLSAPRLSPESAAHVRSRILERIPGRDIPLPDVLDVETLAAGTDPVPHLRLYEHRRRFDGAMRWRATDEEFVEPRARLTFLYGDGRVGAFDPREVVTYLAGGKVHRLRREIRAEARALARLERLGMVPLHEVSDVAGDHGAGDFLIGIDEDDLQDALVRFSFEEVPRLRREGWQVEMAEDYPFRVLDGEVTWYADVSQETGNDWFGLELGVEVNGERRSLLPILLELLREAGHRLSPDRIASMPEDQPFMVRLGDGPFLPLPVRRVRAIIGTLTELYGMDALGPRGELNLSTRNSPRLAELEDAMGEGALRWSGGEALRELGRKLLEFRGLLEVEVPAGFVGTLRPYQRHGLDWLQFLREHDLAGILADDMGLGKTVQLLAHLLVEKQSGRADLPSLVVAPTSLMPNWRREAERFAPGLRILTLQGSGRKQRFGDLAAHDVVLTTYPLLPRDEQILRSQEFHFLVLDEAQFIKNPRTKAAVIARELSARHRVCLTGTPMENHLGELWSLFHTLMPGLLGDEKRFRKLFRNPIEKHGSAEARRHLAARVRPFLLRRTKEEVAPELPPKTEMVQSIELRTAQRDLYESIRLAMHERVRAEVSRRGLARSSIIILDALLKLRQVCCDPRLLKIKQARGVEESAKLEVLMDMLVELTAEGRRILLFSQFTSMLALIETELHAKPIPYVRLTGETRDRDTPVRRFQAGEVPLFLISLKAGGTGLNLPAADTVIHYDPWWNPAVENQATDRAHRIGQDKPVFVYRLIAAGSVEEKIQALQARKRDLAAGIFGAASAGQTPLTADDLEVLFQPLDVPR